MTEVCGHGPVQLDFSDNQARRQFDNELVGARFAEWIATLQNSSDLRIRAAGLVLDGREVGAQVVTAASERARNELVQLALGTSDPAVYGMAVHMCRLYRADDMVEACRQISASRWTYLDPDNAAPWFVIAQEAAAKHDAAAETKALAKAGKSRTLQVHTDSVPGLVAPLLPDGLSKYERHVIEWDIASYTGLSSQPPYELLLRYCSEAAIGERARSAVCSSIANLLVEKGRSLTGFAVGSRIGQRAGWPAARVNALKQELAAMAGGFAVEGAKPNPWSCESLQRFQPILAAEIEAGEVAAGRAAIRISGLSVRELAQHNPIQFDEDLDNLEWFAPDPAAQATP